MSTDSSASQPPEYSWSLLHYGFISDENHRQTPLIAYQPLETALSRLTLSPVLQSHVQTPSFSAFLGEEQQQQGLFCAQPQSGNGGVNGPFGFFGVGGHQNINVGPEAVGFSGRNQYLDADDYNLLRNPHSRNSYNQGNFASSSQQLSLETMKGRIVQLATQRIWSTILNSKLENMTGQEINEIVLPEVVEFMGVLMTSQFGSNFVCHLFEACNEEQRSRIIHALLKFPVLMRICFTSYGAKAMMKLLDKLSTPKQIYSVVSSLSRGALALVTDANGQLVVQFCVKNFSGEYNKPLFIEIANNCISIATNRTGCCVIQLCIEKSYGEARDLLIGEVVANALHLAVDPFGNYVVQFVLALGIQEVAVQLVRLFQGHFLSFSRNKYASNVVEKLMDVSDESLCAKIIIELLTSPDASTLLVDPFGNFVIQKALRESKGNIRGALVDLVLVNAQFMQSNLYGKKILACLGKRQHNFRA